MSMLNDEGLSNLLKLVNNKIDHNTFAKYDEDRHYQVGVKHSWNGNIYKTIVEHDGEEFDITHNELYMNGYQFSNYETEFPYLQDTLFIYNGGIYRTTTNHEPEEFDATHNTLIFSMPNVNVGILNHHIHDSGDVKGLVGQKALVPYSVITMILGVMIKGAIIYDNELACYLVTECDDIFNRANITCISPGTGTMPTELVGNANQFVPTSIDIIEGGLNYTSGDRVTLDNGMLGIITTNPSTGGITGIVNDNANQPYYTYDISGNAVGIQSTASGNGNGAIFSITSSYGSGNTILQGEARYVHSGDPLIQYSRMAKYVQDFFANGIDGRLILDGTITNEKIADEEITGNKFSSNMFESTDNSILIHRLTNNKWNFVINDGNTSIEMSIVINYSGGYSPYYTGMLYMQMEGTTDNNYIENVIHNSEVTQEVNKMTKYYISILDPIPKSTRYVFEQEFIYTADPSGQSSYEYTTPATSYTDTLVFKCSAYPYSRSIFAKYVVGANQEYFANSGFVQNIYTDGPVTAVTSATRDIGSTFMNDVFVSRMNTGEKAIRWFRANKNSYSYGMFKGDSTYEQIAAVGTPINGWAYSNGDYSFILDPAAKKFFTVKSEEGSTSFNTGSLSVASDIPNNILGCFVFDNQYWYGTVWFGVLDASGIIYLYRFIDDEWEGTLSTSFAFVSSPTTICGMCPSYITTDNDHLVWVYGSYIGHLDRSSGTPQTIFNAINFTSYTCLQYPGLLDDSVCVIPYSTSTGSYNVVKIALSDIVSGSCTPENVGGTSNHSISTIQDINTNLIEGEIKAIMYNNGTNWYLIANSNTTAVTIGPSSAVIKPVYHYDTNTADTVTYNATSRQIVSLNHPTKKLYVATISNNYDIFTSSVSDVTTIVITEKKTNNFLCLADYSNFLMDVTNPYTDVKPSTWTDSANLPFTVDKYIFSPTSSSLRVYDYVMNTDKSFNTTNVAYDGVRIGDDIYLIPYTTSSKFAKISGIESGTNLVYTELTANALWNGANGITDIGIDHLGHIYILTGTTAYRYDTKTDSVSIFTPMNNMRLMCCNPYRSNYFAFSSNTALKFNLNMELEGTYAFTALSSPPIRCVVGDSGWTNLSGNIIFILLSNGRYARYLCINDSMISSGYTYAAYKSVNVTPYPLTDYRYYIISGVDRISAMRCNGENELYITPTVAVSGTIRKVMNGVDGYIYVDFGSGGIKKVKVANIDSTYQKEIEVNFYTPRTSEDRVLFNNNDPQNFMFLVQQQNGSQLYYVDNVNMELYYVPAYYSSQTSARPIKYTIPQKINWGVMLTGQSFKGIIQYADGSLWKVTSTDTGGTSAPVQIPPLNSATSILMANRDMPIVNRNLIGFDSGNNCLKMIGINSAYNGFYSVLLPELQRDPLSGMSPIPIIYTIMNNNIIVLVDNTNTIRIIRCSVSNSNITDTTIFAESNRTRPINTTATPLRIIPHTTEKWCMILFDDNSLYFVEIPDDDMSKIPVMKCPTCNNIMNPQEQLLGLSHRVGVTSWQMFAYYPSYMLWFQPHFCNPAMIKITQIPIKNSANFMPELVDCKCGMLRFNNGTITSMPNNLYYDSNSREYGYSMELLKELYATPFV